MINKKFKFKKDYGAKFEKLSEKVHAIFVLFVK